MAGAGALKSRDEEEGSHPTASRAKAKALSNVNERGSDRVTLNIQSTSQMRSLGSKPLVFEAFLNPKALEYYPGQGPM